MIKNLQKLLWVVVLSGGLALAVGGSGCSSSSSPADGGGKGGAAGSTDGGGAGGAAGSTDAGLSSDGSPG